MSTNVSATSHYASQPPEFIKLLANDIRWGLLKALSESDHQVNELVTQLQQPLNLISYHLKKLRDDALVTTRRSEADGRDVYYSLDLAKLRQLYFEAGVALHPAMTLNLPSVDVSRLHGLQVLFVCTHNSARSQMAEGLMRHLSEGQIKVFSAGSHPTAVHPDAVRTLNRFGIDISHQRSRRLDDLSEQQFDFVITVCDKAREVCPTFPGEGRQIHWGFPDPVVIQEGNEREEAFERAAYGLKSRIEFFLSSLSV